MGADIIDLRRICLVGVRGVGKSTLVRAVVPDLPGVDHLLGSAILRELAGEEFQRFDTLAPAVKQAYREEAIRWMERRQARLGRHILCDGHTALLDPTTGRMEQVFTELDCRFFRELILLEAPAEVVQERRRADPSKPRALDTRTIEHEIEGERRICEHIARTYDVTLHCIPAVDFEEQTNYLRGLLLR